MCGEATGSPPWGVSVCTQQMGAGGGGVNEPFEWKTPVLSMTVFRLPSRGLCCSDGVRAGADVSGVGRLRSVRANLCGSPYQ